MSPSSRVREDDFRVSPLVWLALVGLLTVGCSARRVQHGSPWLESPAAPYHLLMEAMGRQYASRATAPRLGQATTEQVRAFLARFPAHQDSLDQGDQDGTHFLESTRGHLKLVFRFRGQPEKLVGVAGILSVAQGSHLPERLLARLNSLYGPPATEPFSFSLDGKTVKTDIQLSRWKTHGREVTYRVVTDVDNGKRFVVLEFWSAGAEPSH